MRVFHLLIFSIIIHDFGVYARCAGAYECVSIKCIVHTCIVLFLTVGLQKIRSGKHAGNYICFNKFAPPLAFVNLCKPYFCSF